MKISIKHIRLFAAIALPGILAVVVLGAIFYSGNFVIQNQPEVSGLNVPKVESEEFEGDVEARKDWFMQQRLYGLGEIPADARQKAKETADLIAPPLAEKFMLSNTWTLIGPQPTYSTFYQSAFGDSSGRINAIAALPGTPNTVLLGTGTGGIWRSTNALDPSPTFTPVSDSQVDLAVGSIAFAPSNTNIVYAGMGDRDSDYLGTGILKSTDTGATWARVDTAGLPARGTTTQIAVSLNDPDTVFASRIEYYRGRGAQTNGGFYRSTNGGGIWTKTFAGSVSSIATHPTNANVIYISVVQTFLEFPTPGTRSLYVS